MVYFQKSRIFFKFIRKALKIWYVDHKIMEISIFIISDWLFRCFTLKKEHAFWALMHDCRLSHVSVPNIVNIWNIFRWSCDTMYSAIYVKKIRTLSKLFNIKFVGAVFSSLDSMGHGQMSHHQVSAVKHHDSHKCSSWLHEESNSG